MKTLKLTKKQTTGGKFIYQVIEDGLVIQERRSARDYVGCTRNGSLFFGREDLALKSNVRNPRLDKISDLIGTDYPVELLENALDDMRLAWLDGYGQNVPDRAASLLANLR